MIRDPLIKKEAPTGRQWVDLNFVAAEGEELLKMMSEPPNELPVGYTAGWASAPNIDYYGHVVEAGAFDKSIQQKGLSGPKGIKLLIQHDRDRMAGVIKVLKTVGEKLWIEAQLNMNIGYVRDFYEAAKMVGGVSFSVGFYIEEYRFVETADMEILHISQGELEEVSLVSFPGNVEATMTYLKEALDEGVYSTIAELEKALVAEGLAKSRNAAARMTKLFKQNIKLFEPVAAPQPPRNAPVAKEKIDALSTLVGELKSLF